MFVDVARVALEWTLTAVALVLVVPCGILAIECVAAAFRARSVPREGEDDTPGPRRGTVAVLVPAHNEEVGIERTVRNVAAQLAPTDRIFVVADNCDDRTAAVARDAGATVVERHDLERRGKGYALAHGVELLAQDPPDVVVIIDADTLVADGALDALATQLAVTGKPAQAAYLMHTPPQPTLRHLVSSFAFEVKNRIRLRGMKRLGLPCHLTGSGMALPWSIIAEANLATGNIVEDMQLGLELVVQDRGAVYCDDAQVSSEFPTGEAATRTQRVRWEHGHMNAILTQAPRMLMEGLRQRRPGLALFALDLAVPPLSLLVAALGVTAIGVVLSGIPAVAAIALAVAVTLLGVAVFAAAAQTQSRTRLSVLLCVPFYILWKLPLYLRFLWSPERNWVRTERDNLATEHPARRADGT